MFQPIVEGLGYEYVGTEYGQADGGPTLRVYIDHADGVDVDDCGKVSRQISALLDVEDPIGDSTYHLEVSSPGIDRPLFNRSHFLLVIDEDLRIKTSTPVLERRNFRGKLLSVSENAIVLMVDATEYEILIDQIEKAYLIGKI